MSEEKRKQWTTEDISALIDAFREHRNLWDPKNINYKNRIKKMDAYKEIADIFGTNSGEVERKLKNVISQYQRERRNYKSMKKSGVDQFFKAKWFGYNAMSFLHDKNKPRKGIQMGGEYEESESSDEEIQTDTQNTDIPSETEGEVENTQLDEEVNYTPPIKTPRVQTEKASNAPKNTHSQQEPNFFTTPKIKTKKSNKNSEEASESTQVFQMMKSMYDKRERDEYDVFGEMVAHNIRNLKSEYSKITAQQRITNLLYEARIFEVPQHNVQSFTSVPSPSPSSHSSLIYSSGNNTTASMTSGPSGQQVQQYTVLQTSNYPQPTEENNDLLRMALSSAMENINSENYYSNK